MKLFWTRKPRGFNHKFIYYDERKARLKAVEERARRELGMSVPVTRCADNLRGVFADSTKHLRRRKECEAAGVRRVPSGIMFFVIIMLVALLRYLLS